MACESLLEEISVKIMVEGNGEDRPYSPTTEEPARFQALLESSQQLRTRPQERVVDTVVHSSDGSLPVAASSFVV